MKLYTHHPRAFRLDGPADEFDPTKGTYWRRYAAYREALPRLQKRVGTDKFLWCEIVPTFQRMTEADDLVGWELNVPHAEILAFIHEAGNWKSLFGNRPRVYWSKLIATPTEAEATGNAEYSCLVRYPFCGATMFEIPPKYPTRK